MKKLRTKCGDCGGYWWFFQDWVDHLLFSGKHQRWLAKNHPKAAKEIYKSPYYETNRNVNP